MKKLTALISAAALCGALPGDTVKPLACMRIFTLTVLSDVAE